jgi:aminomethyltransferase
VSLPESAPLRRTSLHPLHRELGGRMVPFGGFEMPVQYASILKEHDAVRERAGLFDLSHMGQYVLRGAGVAAWADELTVNAVGTMKPLQARYNIFTNDRGGCHDDALFYRLPDRWLLVVNAGNREKMWNILNAAAAGRSDVQVQSDRGERALLAVQGPRAAQILAPFCDIDLGAMKYYFCAEGRVDGVPAVIARTGYTGEDGFELFVEAGEATRLWRVLLEAGSPLGLEPAGLGARDMLRLEAGMPLYGFELSEEISPVAGGQGWAVKAAKPAFTGKAAIVAQLESDDYDRIAGVVLEGRVPARTGYPVFRDGERVGDVRSASVAPSLGNRNIATVLVRKDAAAVGTALQVEIRGSQHAATVVPLPFYKRKA